MSKSQAPQGPYTVFVGTFRRLGGEGIYATTFDSESFSFGQVTLAADVIDPIYMALDLPGDRLFSVAAVDVESRAGLVIAYQLDPATRQLREIIRRPTEGAAACHIDFSSASSVVAVAHYLGASVSAAAVGGEEVIHPILQRLPHRGASVHPQRQAGPHPHSITFDPQGRRAIACDLGTDQLVQYQISGDSADPFKAAPEIIPCSPGAGPRHLAFHPSGRFLYVVNELTSTVAGYHYTEEAGIAGPCGTWSTLPEAWEKLNLPAAIRISSSGDRLYVSNRGHDSIVTFAIDAATGGLEKLGFVGAGGKLPRDIVLTPDGGALLVANERSGSLVALPLNPTTGQPEEGVAECAVPGAVAVLFA